MIHVNCPNCGAHDLHLTTAGQRCDECGWPNERRIFATDGAGRFSGCDCKQVYGPVPPAQDTMERMQRLAIEQAEQRGAERVLRLAEEWSGVSAYDSTRICDEHDCDDSRGRICGADELLQYLKQKLQEPKS